MSVHAQMSMMLGVVTDQVLVACPAAAREIHEAAMESCNNDKCLWNTTVSNEPSVIRHYQIQIDVDDWKDGDAYSACPRCKQELDRRFV